MAKHGARSSDRSSVVPVRHGQQKQSRPWATLTKIVGATLAVLLVSAGSIVGVAAWQLLNEIKVKPTVHLAGQPDTPPPDLGATEGEVNMLLVGSDTRTGQGGLFSTPDEQAASSGAGLNDVNILIHIAGDHKSVTVVSFPRDLMIPIPACTTPSGGTAYGSAKSMLNTALSRAGLSCAVQTISSITGLTIPYAAEIKFDGVMAMSDAVGGVTVCLATPVKDNYTKPPINFPAGQVTLVGPKALSFLRSRHGVGDGGDLGRISNQQVFMSALVRKVTSGGVLSNPLKLYPFATAAVKNMTLSDTLASPTTLVTIGLALKNVGLSNMVFVQYPTYSDPADPNRVIPNPSAAAVLNSALVADQAITLTGKPGVAAELKPTQAATPTTPAGPTGTTAPTGTATTPPAVPSQPAVNLPPSITGQTAAQETCTKKD